MSGESSANILRSVKFEDTALGLYAEGVQSRGGQCIARLCNKYGWGAQEIGGLGRRISESRQAVLRLPTTGRQGRAIIDDPWQKSRDASPADQPSSAARSSVPCRGTVASGCQGHRSANCV